MKSRREFIKTAATVALATPLIGLPNLALAGSGGGKVAVQDLSFSKLSPRDLANAIGGKILEIIRRSTNKEEGQQITEYLNKNPKALDREVKKIVKQMHSKDLKPDIEEKPGSFRITFKFKWSPPDKFEISLKLEF